jgi:hypothetical protein
VKWESQDREREMLICSPHAGEGSERTQMVVLGLEAWLRQYSVCFASAKPRVQTQSHQGEKKGKWWFLSWGFSSTPV